MANQTEGKSKKPKVVTLKNVKKPVKKRSAQREKPKQSKKAQLKPEKRKVDVSDWISKDGLKSDLSAMKHVSEYMQLILFTALPKVQRLRVFGCKSQMKFAELVGVAGPTISNWKAKPGFWDDVNSARVHLFNEDASDVVDAMKRAAIKGNAQSAKLFFDVIGLTKDEKEDDKVPEMLAEALKNVSQILNDQDYGKNKPEQSPQKEA